MNNDKLIGSFYRVYKNLHNKLGEEIQSTQKDFIAARILDRIIVFLFIKENLLNEIENKNIETNIIHSKNIYSKILDFYKKPTDFVMERINIVSSITKLFKVEKLEIYQDIDETVVKEIIKKLNKFKWKFNEDTTDGITLDVLGKVFEKYINQKETGAYYTELDTIQYINSNSIMYSLLSMDDMQKLFEEKKINRIYCETMIKDNEDILKVFEININQITDVEVLKKIKIILKKFKLIDITVGTGAFIIDAIDNINEIYRILNSRLQELGVNNLENNLDILIDIVENNIYGVDIMEDAVEMAKFRIYLKIINICITNNIDINTEIKLNIKVGNTIVGDINWKGSKQLNILEKTDCIYDKKFDWYIEFDNVIINGGFNCIIGNPPYIEYKQVQSKYEINNFETIKSGNIYAFVLERAIDLLNNNGVIGFIVPISIVSTQRMMPLRKFLEEKCEVLFYSNFGDRPATLFNGVHQKLSILIGKKNRNSNWNNKPKVYTSQYYHWYKEERNKVFGDIKYIENNYKNNKFYYKIGNDIQQSIIEKININTEPISEMIKKNSNLKYSVFLSTRLTFWVKSFINKKMSNEFKEYFFEDMSKALVFNAVLNSSLYYFWWESVSDCWHLTNKELELFYFDYDKLSKGNRIMLEELSIELERSLEENKKFIGSKQAEYEYKHKFSKIIIDKIDNILSKHYGFSEEELKYILDYNLSYRMNDELENYLKNRYN